MLNNKVAIITGASSGIGRASALLFARNGAAVVVGARREAELDRLVLEITAAGGRAFAAAGDVTDESYAQLLVAHAVEHFGGLDIALNNAGGIGEMGPSTAISTAGWNDTLASNLTSAFFGARAQIPAMLARGNGSLIFTATFVGHTVGFPQAAAYAASKSGVIGLMKALAAEYGPQGLRVNALLPGGTDTAMAHAMNSTQEAMTFVRSLHALKRIAAPEEIAQAALFLASPASSFMTGTAMLVDGGVSINRT
jgi:NAD(P)-dependent dehydrogenase (short-subunit alcohol dehydrogenase family)